MNKAQEILLFSTQEYAYLAQSMQALDPRLVAGDVERREFPDGEHYLRILTSVENHDVVMVGGTSNDRATLELYDLCCAIVKYGARRLTILIPFFGYSTMERQVNTGDVVMAKTRARLLSAIPLAAQGNRVMMLDLHSEGIPHYFEGPVRAIAISGRPVIIELCRYLGGTNFVLGSTDAGRAKWVESLANDLGVSPAFVYKKRLDGHTTVVTGVSAYVKDHKVVIYDDMIRTGGSLLQAAKVYKDEGATEIFAVATHGVFPQNALARLRDSGLFKRIACTDSHPESVRQKAPGFLEVVSIEKILINHLS